MEERKIECKILKQVREKKKLTPSELQKITEIAKEELKFLARNNIPLVPENYVLWFEVFCYIVENELKLSDLEVMGLFKEKYTESAEIESVSVNIEPGEKGFIKEVVSRVASEIDNMIENLDEYNRNLSRKEKSFKRIGENAEDLSIKDMVSQILMELREIRKQNEELKKKLEEANGQIKKLAEEFEVKVQEETLDFLTQVANRASFDRALSDMVNDFYRRSYPFALIMIDIDDFKKINDTYGHQAGDYVLQELARLLKSQLRARDVIARYGGEEFAILLPGVTFSQALRVAERLRKSVEKHLFKFRDLQIPVTISLGLAMMREGFDETAVIEKADKALYLAKRSGKNQVKTDLDVELEE